MKNDGSERMVMVVCDRTIAMDGDAMHARYLYAANKQHSIQSSEIIQRGARGIGKRFRAKRYEFLPTTTVSSSILLIALHAFPSYNAALYVLRSTIYYMHYI